MSPQSVASLALKEKICQTVADVLEMPVSEVGTDHHFINDLGANSLDVVEFVMRLEELLSIEIPDEAADDVETVGELVAYIEKLVGGAPTPSTGKTVCVASDHAGYQLTQALQQALEELGWTVIDLGAKNLTPGDYPEYALRVAHSVARGEASFGVLVCGTGIGMSIAANKVAGIRAALVHTTYEAEMARKHNDANVLCFGARVIGEGQAIAALTTFFQTAFEPGDDGRHQRRVDLIRAAEVAAAADAKLGTDTTS